MESEKNSQKVCAVEKGLQTIRQLTEYLMEHVYEELGERDGERQLDMLQQILLIAIDTEKSLKTRSVHLPHCDQLEPRDLISSKINEQPEDQKITFFKTGPGEYEGMQVEDLFMKLATIELVLKAFCNYAEQIEINGGVDENGNNMPPDDWAVTAAFQDLARVNHALKCGAFGYQTAFLH